MSYEGIRITEELDRAVQRAVSITPQRHETRGELVRDIATQRGVCRPENLISERPTRHEVRVDGQIFHTYCFLDALMVAVREAGRELRGALRKPCERWGGHGADNRGVGGRFAARRHRVLRRRSGRRGTDPRDALLLPQRLPFPRRV